MSEGLGTQEQGNVRRLGYTGAVKCQKAWLHRSSDKSEGLGTQGQ